jgi:hypothetical protein
LSPFLNSGDIFAPLHSDGKVPVSKLSWNMFAMHGAISYAQFFNIQFGMLSGPLMLIFFDSFSIPSMVDDYI